MAPPKPYYTLAETRSAFQLDWSLTTFWREPAPPDAAWLESLCAATEPDGVRILQHAFADASCTTSQFLLSTRPEVSPSVSVRSVKGRLQHLVRSTHPRAFQRNFALRGIGSATREQVESYVASQVAHHPVADVRFAKELESLRIENEELDLSKPVEVSHGLYWYNLHVVLVTDWRERETRADALRGLSEGVKRIADARGYGLKSAAIMPDHIHLFLRPAPTAAPGEVAVCFMNNLCLLMGQRAIFEPGFFVGTVGEYRRSAIRG